MKRRSGARQSSPPPACEVRVERIGGDGDGIAALPDGTPVYIPFALPGETARVRPESRRGEGWGAVLESLRQPSPERVDAPRVHFDTCGGCALQHWQQDATVAWKLERLSESLGRAGFALSAPAGVVRIAAATRRRVELAMRRHGPTISLGLHQARGTAIVDLAACEVMRHDLFALVAPLREALRGLDGLRQAGTAVISLLESGADVLLRLDAKTTAADRTALAAFACAHGVARVSVSQGDGTAETACLLKPATITFSGAVVTPPPGAFLQASREGEQAIVAAALAGLPERMPRKARVAELYAGVGTLTFALAATAAVSAFEGNADAADALNAAARSAGLAHRIAVERRDLARQPLSAEALAGFAAVVLDPPYGGALEQTAQIAASGAGRVVYVSCNPAALARDAKLLKQGGYRVVSATLIDQFLWSARLESVAVFAR